MREKYKIRSIIETLINKKLKFPQKVHNQNKSHQT